MEAFTEYILGVGKDLDLNLITRKDYWEKVNKIVVERNKFIKDNIRFIEVKVKTC